MILLGPLPPALMKQQDKLQPLFVLKGMKTPIFSVSTMCVCVFEVLTHQWFVNTVELLEVLEVSLSRKNQPKK